MNIFEGLRSYAGKWMVKSSRLFSEEEKSLVSSAEVVASQYGNSVCFHMKSGSQTFIPLDQNSSLTPGMSVSLEKAIILTLERDGDRDITRIKA